MAINVSRYPRPLSQSPHRSAIESGLRKEQVRKLRAAGRMAPPVDPVVPPARPVRKQLAVIPPCNHIEGSPSFYLVRIDNDYYIQRSSATQEFTEYGPFDRARAGDYWIDVIETIEKRK